MTTSALRDPATLSRPGPVKHVAPVKSAALAGVNPAWRNMLEACLEGGFLPETADLTSFLVNALYLFGGNSIAAFGNLPPGVTDELTRLGHGVRPAHGQERREGRKGNNGRGGRGSRENDRAVLLQQAFGRGTDAEILEQLRSLRRALRPGGLVCFHVFDRDRAWSLAGERAVAAGERKATVRIGFDPASGRISARLSHAVGPGGPEVPGCGGFLAVKAWNLPEIRALLRGAGFELERSYGDWQGNGPEHAATGRLIVVAGKPRRARARRRSGMSGKRNGGSP